MWTLIELMLARQYMPLDDNTIASEGTVRDRFREFGGIPRVVFGSQRQAEAFTRSQVRQVLKVDMIRDVLQGSLPDDVEGEDNIPTYLFGYKSKDPFDASAVSIEPLSDGAHKQIFEKHYNLMMNLVCSLKPPQVDGCKFEDFVGWLLAEGVATLQLESLPCQEWTAAKGKWVPSDRFFLPREQRLWQCDNVPQFLETWQTWKRDDQRGVLRAPAQFPGIDYLLSAFTGVNVAGGKSHADPPPAFYQHLKDVGVDPGQFQVLYFVPGVFYDQFFVNFASRSKEPAEAKPRAKAQAWAKGQAAAKLQAQEEVAPIMPIGLLKVSVPMSTSSLVAIREQ